jgi:Dissimilatory sulfite reductase (desulfoviridin), alpha and beta subunits
MQQLGRRIDYDAYLTVSKEYIDSQQRPVRLLDETPEALPRADGGQGFRHRGLPVRVRLQPCSFSCKQGAITKSSTSVTPKIDYDKCIGCMECVAQCPGLAIFGYRKDRNQVFLPLEFNLPEGGQGGIPCR